jgi:hypothetical protein
MYGLIVNIGVFLSFFIAILCNYKAKNIKRLEDLKPITNILLIGALFDIITIFYQSFTAQHQMVVVYSITFPLCIILNVIFPKFKNLYYFLFVLILTIIACSYIPFPLIGNFSRYYFLTAIIVQILSIITCAYKVLSLKRILQPVNYFFFILLGFVILNFFWFLGYYKITYTNFKKFMEFHYYFIMYLTIFRFIYIFYIVRFLKPFRLIKNYVKINTDIQLQ